MKNVNVEYAFGSPDIQVVPCRPYSENICDFLDRLSKAIREDTEAKAYPDIITFAFWIRRANVQKLKQNWKDCNRRIGKGLIFHIAPSNVPINFAYTLVFGLLAGNSNIVKVSSKRFPQEKILCRIMEQVAQRESFQWVREQNAVVIYDRNSTEITEELSKKCDVRIIWGGDHTIARIRQSELMPRATEITFADRYSFGMISSEKVLAASEEELQSLAQKFYNDTYLMDQNACSTPHLICWYGNKVQMEQAKTRFWQAVYENVQEKYDLAEVKVSEKYTILCELANRIDPVKVKRYENLVYVVELMGLPDSITELRGKFGLFFDCCIGELEEIAEVLNDKKIQTCAVYGINAETLADMLIRKHIRGIDRIVPFGNTLDVGTIWDGYDIISELSRCMVCIS